MRWLLLLPALLTLQAFADEEKSFEERVRFLEQKRGYQFKKRRYQGLAKGELLYWKADVDGVAYSTTFISENAQGTAGQVETNIKTRTPHFSYDPGFRVGIGLQSPYDLFDVFLVWTRFYTDGSDHAHGTLVPSFPEDGDKVIFDGIGLIKGLVSFPNKASAECRIKENLLDVQLARGIAVSRHFFMRPYFGIKGVWSHLDWDIKAKRNFVITDAFNQDATQLKVKNDFNAVGALIGLEINWKAPMGFGVSVKGAGALVWGLTEERTKQKYLFIPAGTDTRIKQNFKAGNSFHSMKALWELFAGVFWETHLSGKEKMDKAILSKTRLKQRSSIRLFAGYEFQQWPNVGQKTNIQSSRQRDRFSLGFQGFTGGVKIVL